MLSDRTILLKLSFFLYYCF